MWIRASVRCEHEGGGGGSGRQTFNGLNLLLRSHRRSSPDKYAPKRGVCQIPFGQPDSGSKTNHDKSRTFGHDCLGEGALGGRSLGVVRCNGDAVHRVWGQPRHCQQTFVNECKTQDRMTQPAVFSSRLAFCRKRTAVKYAVKTNTGNFERTTMNAYPKTRTCLCSPGTSSDLQRKETRPGKTVSETNQTLVRPNTMQRKFISPLNTTKQRLSKSYEESTVTSNLLKSRTTATSGQCCLVSDNIAGGLCSTPLQGYRSMSREH